MKNKQVKLIKNTIVNFDSKRRNDMKIITDGITNRNEKLEKICYMTQPQLKEYLKDELKDKEQVEGDGFLYVKGNLPILLVAHMDTVHKELPTEMIYANGTLSSPMGIGADDRAGVYMILEILKHHDCSLLFCEDEEKGCVGAKKFCKTDLAKELKGTFCYLVELDRMNSKDAVFYECDNPDFEEFITQEYWKTDEGSFTDIVELSPILEAASVNFSCGYYKQHSTNEYLVLDEMERNIKEVCKLIDRTDTTVMFEYIERERIGLFDDFVFTSSKKNKLYDGYGDENYYFVYFDEKGFDAVEKVSAYSPEEAVGIFLMEHSEMCYCDVLDILTEDEFYDFYM
jgi:hypothetical protein